MRNGQTTFYYPGVAVGTLLMVLGVVVMMVCTLATVEIALLLGMGLIVSGCLQVFHVPRYGGSSGWATRFLLAAISVIAGIVVLRNPVVGAFVMTLAMGSYFLLTGLARGLLVYEMGASRGRAWLTFSAVLSFVLGVYLVATLPVSSQYIPGLFLGMDIFFYGAFALAHSGEAVSTRLSSHDVDVKKAA